MKYRILVPIIVMALALSIGAYITLKKEMPALPPPETIKDFGSSAKITLDDKGQVVTVHYPNTGAWRFYIRNQFGDVVDITTSHRGYMIGKVELEYDLNSKITSVKSFDGGSKQEYHYRWDQSGNLNQMTSTSGPDTVGYPFEKDPTKFKVLFQEIADRLKQLARQHFEVNSQNIRVNVGAYDGVVVSKYRDDVYAFRVVDDKIVVENLNQDVAAEVDITTGNIAPNRMLETYPVGLKGPIIVTGYNTDNVRLFPSKRVSYHDSSWVVEVLLALQQEFY